MLSKDVSVAKIRHDLVSIYSVFKSSIEGMSSNDKRIVTASSLICDDCLIRLSQLIDDLSPLDLVLIDDDKMVRDLWEIEAQKYSKKIVTLESYDEFIKLNVEKNVPIYVDKNLGNSVSGLDILRKLDESGYRRKYLATGEVDTLSIEQYSNCLTGIIGKKFPICVE